MRRRTKLKKLLAFLLTVSMVFSMNVTVFAENDTSEETPKAASCTQDETCGAETHEEGCPKNTSKDLDIEWTDNESSETGNGEGEENPADTLKTATCTKNDSCESATHEEGCPKAVPVEDADKAASPAEPTAMEKVQARIDALPEAEALADMNEEEKAAIYEKVREIYNEIDKMTDEEAAGLKLDRLEAASEFFTPETATLDVTDVDICKIGETGYSTLQAAVDAAVEGDIIVLQKEVTECVTIPESKSITLDVNGKTLTNKGDFDTIINEGVLTVTGSGTLSNTVNGKAVLINKGTATLKGGNFQREDTTGNSYYTVVNHGNMTVDGANISNSGSLASCLENGWYNTEDVLSGGATLNMVAGTVSGGLNAVKNDAGGILNIEGGTISNSTQYAVMNWNKATISGGNISCTAVQTASVYPAAVYNAAYGTDENSVGLLTINGGELTTTEGSTYALDNRSEAVISGTAKLTGGSSAVQAKGVDSKTTITGGTLVGQKYYGMTASGGSKVEISGGNIKGGSSASGYTVRAVDKGTELLITGGTFTNYEGTPTGTANVYVGLNSKVDIQGGEFSGSSKYAVHNNNGALTISGGIFESPDSAVYVRNSKGASAEISGGSFISTDVGKPAVTKGTNGSLVISGGSFSSDVSPYVIDGNTAIMQDNGTYIIGADTAKAAAQVNGKGYVTVQEAVNAAAECSGTVILLQDKTESITIPEGKTLILDLNGKTLTNTAGNHTITNNGTLTITGSGTVDNVSHAKAALVNNGTVTIENGTFSRSQESSTGANSGGGNSWYVVWNTGDMTVNGGTFKFSDSNHGLFSSLIVNGWPSPGQNTAKEFASLTVNGGEFIGGKMTIKNDDYGKMKMTGGTVTQPEKSYYALFSWNEAEVSGGTINGTVGAEGDGKDNYEDGYIKVTGNTIVNGNVEALQNSKVLLENGVFNGKIGVYEGADATSLQVSGGTFSNEVPEEFCADNFHPNKNPDGTYSVHIHSGAAAVKENEKAATCTAAGSYDSVVYCSVCQEEMSRETVTISAGHSYNKEEWKNDGTNHWHECTVCGDKTDVGAHTYGDWTVTKKATKKEAGIQEKTCTTCGHKVIEEIPKLKSSSSKKKHHSSSSDTVVTVNTAAAAQTSDVASAQTGDNSPILLLSVLCLAALAGMGTVLLKRRKR